MRSQRALAVAVAVMSATGLAGCGSSSSGESVTAVNANGCTKPPPLQAAPQHYSQEPPLTIARTTYTATIGTNCGAIVMALNGKRAPHTVNSFAFLAGKGYFTNTPCQRLTTSNIFVLQCGDPTGTGRGGPGYTLPDENLAGATYPTGTVAMANSGFPHTGGSQFFLVYADTSLPPQYTPFGHITAGLDVLQRIAKAGDNGANGPGDGAPNQPVSITSFKVVKGTPTAS